MSDTIEIYVDLHDEKSDIKTCLVGRCRYIAKHNSQSSVFEYADEWLANPKNFALDPANLD